VAYQVFESLEVDGRPQPIEALATAGPATATRVLGTYATWRGALRVVARVEASARRQPCGKGGFALGIRSDSRGSAGAAPDP